MLRLRVKSLGSLKLRLLFAAPVLIVVDSCKFPNLARNTNAADIVDLHRQTSSDNAVVLVPYTAR